LPELKIPDKMQFLYSEPIEPEVPHRVDA